MHGVVHMYTFVLRCVSAAADGCVRVFMCAWVRGCGGAWVSAAADGCVGVRTESAGGGAKSETLHMVGDFAHGQ